MAANREECFAALFALLEQLGTPAGGSVFKFTSRVFQSWDDTPPPQCPAMFMVKGAEEQLPAGLGLPPLWRLRARVVVYARLDEGRLEPPSVQLNEIMTAVEGALERKPIEGPPTIPPKFVSNPAGYFGTTLGGLCFGCQLAGQIQTFEGVIGGDSMMIAEIEILTSA